MYIGMERQGQPGATDWMAEGWRERVVEDKKVTRLQSQKSNADLNTPHSECTINQSIKAFT